MIRSLALSRGLLVSPKFILMTSLSLKAIEEKIGTLLINTLEKYYENCGFDNINLCISEFQAPIFYEKLGFKLEFIRKK